MLEKLKILRSNLWPYILPFLRRLMREGGTILAGIALTTVHAVESSVPGTNKRELAIKIVKEQLKERGLAFAKAEIAAAVELAVISMQESK